MTANRTNVRLFLGSLVTVLAAALVLGGTAQAKKDELPETTTEGLRLATNNKHRIVYVADDVDFKQYSKVYIVDCAVAFKKNWQRDYNRNERDLSRQVRDSDVTRIKNNLAAEFKKVFTETMTEQGIEVVTEAGPDVIILRPAIINLVVNAPDIRSAGRAYQFTGDPGQMTLYLELYDSVSSAMLAKIMDAQDAGRRTPTMNYTTSVSNIAAADRILKGWATELATHFSATTDLGAANDTDTDAAAADADE